MNKRALLVVSIAMLIAGCVTPEDPQSMGPLGTVNCAVHEPTDSCTGNPDDPKVTLNLNTMKANPPNVCARAGKTINISIVPTQAASVGNVAVVPKSSTDTWLIGTNVPDKLKITIPIPNDIAFGTDHDFGFVTSDGKCADPRVHVM